MTRGWAVLGLLAFIAFVVAPLIVYAWLSVPNGSLTVSP